MTTYHPPTELADIDKDRIDSRDLVELRDLLTEYLDGADGKQREEIRAEIDAITELFEEISNYAGDSPEDGIFLISDDSFEDYARELADDIGAVSGDGGWPTYCIDWAWAARELQQNYTEVRFRGVDYWYR